MFSPSPNKKTARRGFVLVSVLMLGVVFISCATAFVWFTRLQVKNIMREKAALENRSMAQVLTLSIMAGLKADSTAYDSPQQTWYQPFSFYVEDLGTWVVQITPLDDKIPIRNLFLPDGNTLRSDLRSTWEALWAKLDATGLVNIALDFMGKSTKPRVGGAKRENFINRYPLDMSEFLILEEITPELLYGAPGTGKFGLADYCTLWSDGKINLNVAPVHVMEILPGLDKMQAEKIADYRNKEAITSTSDLRKIPGFPAKAMASMMNISTVSSRYFMIRIELLENNGGGTSINAIFDKSSSKVVRWEEI